MKRNFAAFNEASEAVRAEIEKLANPTPQALTERAEHQDELAQLTAERNRKTAAIQEALHELRRFLREPAELTSRMRSLGDALGLSVNDWDEEPFHSLIASPPGEVPAVSDEWSRWFLGPADAREPEMVRCDCVIYPETLGDHGVRIRSEEGSD